MSGGREKSPGCRKKAIQRALKALVPPKLEQSLTGFYEKGLFIIADQLGFRKVDKDPGFVLPGVHPAPQSFHLGEDLMSYRKEVVVFWSEQKENQGLFENASL